MSLLLASNTELIRGLHRLIIAIAILLKMAIVDIYAQDVIDVAAKVSYEKEISNRWIIGAELAYFQQLKRGEGFAIQSKATCQFKFMEKRFLFMVASFSDENYHGSNHSDIELRLIEGLHLNTEGLFSHGMYLSQRRLIYAPSGDMAFCSDLTYYQKISFPWIWERVRPVATMSESINITPDNSKATLFQRFRVGPGIDFRINNKLSLLFSYHYAVGGKNQIFIGDRHKLHYFSLSLNIKKLKG